MRTYKTRIGPWAWGAAGGVVLLVVMGLTAGDGHGASRSSQRSVARNLDTIIQARFQKTEDMFGMGRLAGPIGHYNIFVGLLYSEEFNFHPASRTEDEWMRRANASGHSFIISFLRSTRPPGRLVKGGFGVPTDPQPEFKPSLIPLFVHGVDLKQSAGTDQIVDEGLRDELQAAALAQLPDLLKGKGKETKRKDLLVVMRPVRALQASCLGCHTHAHAGDTLGVMVYAVR